MLYTGKAIKVSSAETPEENLEQASDEFLELANGCLCCSIKDSGVAAIEKLMSRKGAFDHILLETTGLADPGRWLVYCFMRFSKLNCRLGPIAAMFWQNEDFAMGLGKDIYLDGVICVVDAVFAEKVPLLFLRAIDHSFDNCLANPGGW
jgi:G3E family GTPase